MRLWKPPGNDFWGLIAVPVLLYVQWSGQVVKNLLKSIQSKCNHFINILWLQPWSGDCCWTSQLGWSKAWRTYPSCCKDNWLALPPGPPLHGCQMVIAKFVDYISTALRGWRTMAPLRCAAKLIPSFPWIALPRPPPWRNPRKGRVQILLRSIAEPWSFKPKGPNTQNQQIWLHPSGNHGNQIRSVSCMTLTMHY